MNPTNKNSSFEDVVLDGIQASYTTQWSGIFVLGASHVRIRNCMAHDMQGDGLCVYESNDAVISRSVAWHTGMQEKETIGTPMLSGLGVAQLASGRGNEAFLTDSPGVDGGAFDIDYGNVRNTVRRK